MERNKARRGYIRWGGQRGSFCEGIIFKQRLEEMKKLAMSVSWGKAFQVQGAAGAKALRHFLINHHFRILPMWTSKISKFPLTVRWFLPQTEDSHCVLQPEEKLPVICEPQIVNVHEGIILG